MIGIKTFVAVVISYTVFYFVHRYDFRGFGTVTHAVATRLETGTVSRFGGGAARPVTVVKRPAVVYHNGLAGVDEVEAVVTVPPCTATSEYITASIVVGVSAEAVHITAPATVRNGIVVIVSVTVQYQVVSSFHQIKTDSHAIVHGQVLIDIVIAAPVAETFRLGMPDKGDLCTYYFDILEMQVGAADIEHADTLLEGLYLREVEYRTFTRITEVTDTVFVVRSAFVHQEYAGVDFFSFSHNLRLFHDISPAADIYYIAGFYFRLRTRQRSERRIDVARIGIVAVGCHIVFFGCQHYRQAK